jgi:ParB family protein of integrating conjugative element (PFGI_1 class)
MMAGKGRKLEIRGLDVDAGRPATVPDVGGYPILNLTMDMVPIDKISFFEGNPRTSPNPKYVEIKESIRATGLDNPLPISHRPSDPEGQFIIYAGGNTRLRALKELWEETKDPQFMKAKCRYIPFGSDLDARIMHARENDMRGDMTFIDSAKMILTIRDGLEVVLAGKLSLRGLEEELKKRGLPNKSASLIAKYEYAVMLDAHIPKALRAGMGRPQIERLQKLEKAGLAVWRFHGDRYGAEQAFRDRVFVPALAGSDSDAWAYEATEAAVRLRLLASLPQGTDADTVQASLKLALAGKELKAPTITPELPPALPPVQEPAPQQAPAYAPLDQYAMFGGAQPAPPAASDGVAGQPPATGWDWGGLASDDDGGLDGDGLGDWTPAVPVPLHNKDVVIAGSARWPEKLKQLRERNYKLATKLSNLYVPDGSDAIAEINVGSGFIPKQLFNPPFLVQLQRNSKTDIDALAALLHTANIWWFLAEISGMFPSEINDRHTCPQTVLAQHTDLSEGSPLYDKEMMPLLNPCAPPHERLSTWWLKLHDSHLDIVVELVRNVRAINDMVLTHAGETDNATVWEITT